MDIFERLLESHGYKTTDEVATRRSSAAELEKRSRLCVFLLVAIQPAADYPYLSTFRA
jgi:hypothetical protein